ncbi:uncharacterized protein BDZ99DRAFT_526611 [Mytilinidion resinicola]|uniref:Uncharacterized protein n=1 Tax=Mytilinidion resinicola TaxID=574789 RepID=A0A6A6Y3N2_9PEZI|nr:uncharacterized protein BDZ99DRAFT_526611 [Mytilinidion resinicola]KAF2803239.1 hypothetical protein BDZ99DRAFT_526611 [Mytilinidion resinicola]
MSVFVGVGGICTHLVVRRSLNPQYCTSNILRRKKFKGTEVKHNMLTKGFILAFLSSVIIAAPVSINEERSLRARNEGHVLTKPFEANPKPVAARKQDEVDGSGQWKREKGHFEVMQFHTDARLSEHDKVGGDGHWKRQDEVEGGGDWKRDEFERDAQ